MEKAAPAVSETYPRNSLHFGRTFDFWEFVREFEVANFWASASFPSNLRWTLSSECFFKLSNPS